MAKKIELEISRVNGETKFVFKIDPYLTELYAKQAQEKRKSEAWPGLEFYYVPRVIESEKYKKLLEEYHLFDTFGSRITDGKRFNIAWIRTVQGGGEIKIEDDISFAEMSFFIRNTTNFLKEYFNEFFRDAKVNGSVTLEV